MADKKELLVIALGGNALSDASSKGSVEDHMKSIERTAKMLLPLFEKDYDIVINARKRPSGGQYPDSE